MTSDASKCSFARNLSKIVKRRYLAHAHLEVLVQANSDLKENEPQEQNSQEIVTNEMGDRRICKRGKKILDQTNSVRKRDTVVKR
jgi:hypothetical protein